MMPPNRRLSWMGLKSWQAGHRTWRRDQRDKRVRPTLTLLEERTLLSTLNLTVTTLADDPVTPTSGQTTLRDAITQANASTDSQEVISFAVDGTINLTSYLPILDNNISIDGPEASNLTVQRDFSASSSIFVVDIGVSVNLSGMTITGGYVSNNSGGGILNAGTLTVNNSTFTDNYAHDGGGIGNIGTLTVNNSSFTDNSAHGGGGILNDTGTLTVNNSTFTNNSAPDGTDQGHGGGICNQGGSALNITNSTFTDNSAYLGGGIDSNFGTGMVTNCTISGNTSQDDGGIWGENGPDGYGTMTLNNTIVAGNTGYDISDYIQPTSANNLIGNGTGITNLAQLAPSNLIGTTADINPMLGSLANNGGPTNTMALLPGSPAIDAGSNALAVDANGNPLTTDQRGVGFPRILGHSVDMGAYEFTPLNQTISFGALANQTYGAAPITLTATATSNLPVSYTVISGPATISGSVLTVTGAGLVDVEADQAGNATYAAATPVDESFTVSPAQLTITANPAVKLYGAALPTLTASYTGFVNGDTVARLTTPATLNTPATASSPVLSGGYDIRVSGASDPNYNISYIDGTLTVTPAPLIITANNVVKLYGAALPTLTASCTGFVNGDTVSSLTTAPTLTTTAAASSPVTGSPFPITVSGASDLNYIIEYQTGQLWVNPAPLTITANNATKVYGAAVPSLSASYSGFVNGDTVASLIALATTITTVTASSSVGDYTSIASGASDPNYTIAYIDGTLTVTPAPLTVSATSKSMVYGSPLPALTYAYTGLVNNDPSATFSGSLATTATSSSNVGAYPINEGNLAATGNYTINTFNPGTLTVIAAPLTVTATNESMTYGSTVPVLGYTYTGLVNKDTSATCTGSLVTTATSSSNVGGYPINEGNLAATGNYTINTFNPSTLTVTPAPLTVSATSKSMVYGGTVPTPLTYTYTGLVNNDTSATFSGSLATTATSSSNVGDYAITEGTLAATGNYTINTFNPGTLTVIAAPLTVTATNESMTYGSTVPVLGYTYTGLVNNDPSATFSGSLATTATSSSNVGDYPITQGTLAATGNYTIDTFNPSTLSIAKANAIVVVTPYSVVYNGAAHTATGIATGINGVSLNGLVGNSTHTNAGTYSDTWTFTDTTVNYYNASGTITDAIAKATANITVVGYTTTYDGMPHEAAGAAIDVNNTVLGGLNVPAHTNSGTYIDTWTFSNPNYNYASGTVVNTIAKANANIAVVGYNTFYNAVSHIAIGAVYGVSGVALSGVNLSNTVHTSVGTYTDVWTFTDTTGNYNNASGTVVDTITPSKSKMVSETVLVPRTTVVKATVLVPVVKEVKVVERVKVGNKWVKKTVLVPETVLVKKTVLVNETKMTK